MILYLLRHGEAEHNPIVHDSERTLSPKGHQQAQNVAQFLTAIELKPQLILTSPLLRAQETAHHIADSLNVPVQPTEYLVNNTNPLQLLQQLNTLTVDAVLCVGHQPYLGELISLLLSDSLNIEFEIKPCTLATIDSSRPLKFGKGILKALIPSTYINALIHYSGGTYGTDRR